ncbi:MAG: CHASE3 domain-containing protein [Rhodoferax sp.]|nr:CHASE3 domain-containing protein [Rhodoferax sp.]
MSWFKLLKHHRVSIVLACTAGVAMVTISESAYWRSEATLADLRAMNEARAQVEELTRSVVDAEAGQRGYLLTRRDEYLEPYHQALGRIGLSFKALDAHFGQQPEPREMLKRLRELTDTKLSELALTMRLLDEGKPQTSNAILLTDIGKEKMDAIRDVSAELLGYQTRNAAASNVSLKRTLLLGRVGVALLSALSLLALYFYLRQSQALKLQEQALQDVLLGERDRLEREVLQRTAELRELTHHLQTAREDERHRLARNLHDDLGSLLTSAKLDAARIKPRLAGTPPETQELLAHLVTTLNSGIALGRSIIEDLRPSALSNLGLLATLEILSRDYADRSGTAVHCALEPVQLKPSAELVVYRLVQEAMTNISKYAQARNVWVELVAGPDQVQVSVRDDGVGFNAKAKTSSAYGLVGMRFRVESEGGSLQVTSAPGQGAHIRARLPTSVALADAPS